MSTRSDGRIPWHRLEVAEVLDELEASGDGLTPDQAQLRLEHYGRNELKEKPRKSVAAMILDQFRDFMIIVLIVAAVVAGVIGEAADTIAIVVIVVLNAVLGFVQEYRAEQAMAALKRMAAPSATVVRDGSPKEIDAARLVPGDRVVLQTGSVVPADVRLSDAVQLRTDEAALTGESLPVEKTAARLEREDAPVAERTSMAYKGTLVAAGRGEGFVVATGMRTELGRIASLLEEQDEGRTPLQRRLAVFGQRLAWAVLAISTIVFVTGLLRGEPAMLMLLTAISLAVAAIPEALPAVVTISLALGARKLVRRDALVRKLPAVETLGSVTYVCRDKTGTLTQNRMSVEELRVGERTYRREEIHRAHGSAAAGAPVDPATRPVEAALTA